MGAPAFTLPDGPPNPGPRDLCQGKSLISPFVSLTHLSITAAIAAGEERLRADQSSGDMEGDGGGGERSAWPEAGERM